ncbi:MAG TPA: FkbM family methyltransferase [Synechococcus sp. M44_DOE_062]|nr:FkbM family methyltransferase [Synechococcus sp. M44_DOE_062]
MTFEISAVLGSAMPTIKVVAVGAMDLGSPEIYTPLLEKGIAEVIGFEANARECEKLNRAALLSDGARQTKRRYLPYAVGDGSRRTFHITNTGYTSSLFPPNIKLLSEFHGLAELCQVVEVQEVDTVRLDDVKEIEDADWLVLDAQGAEVDILRGATQLLKKVVVVQTEVLYIPHYEGQPLFGDVDVELRKHGFLINGITHFSCPPMKALPAQPYRPQLGWSDFIYVRNFMNLRELEDRKRLALAVILHEIYGSHDLCAHVLKEHDAVTSSGFYGRYLAKFMGS